MPFVAAHPEAYTGKVVGNGHCVAFVRAAANAPHTSAWVEGKLVWEVANTLASGTAIATFSLDGRYANATDGSSHTAIFLTADATGITVFDQWVGSPVAKRFIRNKGGEGLACDDADAFSVIES